MLEYIIIITILIILIPLIYTRIQYPFWSVQPIFHTYDFFRYWTQKPFVIQNGYPLKTKYLSDLIATGNFLDLNNDELDKVILFIQEHYIESDRALTMINKYDITHQLSGYSNPSFISVYKDKQIYQVQENNQTEFEEKNTMVGVITSRAVKIYMLYSQDNFEEFVYYMDHICTHRNMKNKYLGRSLIQNHERYQRFNNKTILGSLFKRESLCDGIVPLLSYDVNTFPLSEIKKPPMRKFSTQRITGANVNILFDFLYNVTHNIEYVPFSLCIFPETNAFDHLIQHNQIIVYALLLKSNICAFYFFKDSKIAYDLDEERNILECIGSISTNHIINSESDDVFFGGFLHALHHIQDIYNNKFKLLTIYDISHNKKLIKRWKWKYSAISLSKSAYYLYNAVMPYMPFHEADCLIIL